MKLKCNKLNLKFTNKYSKIIENKKMAEARAWVKKYFKEDSEENKFFDLIIKGIKDNKLISNPIQILNHEADETAIRVPIIIKIKNKNL